MKKQTTVLVVSLVIVLILTGTMFFVAARFRDGSEGSSEEGLSASDISQEEELHLLSISSSEINTITIENPSDQFTLVNQGDGFVVEGFEEMPVSKLNINNLVAFFSDLTAELELASLSDSKEEQEQVIGDSETILAEYGLVYPDYKIQITTTDGKEEKLVIGNHAPDNNSIYLLYSDKVYLLDDALLDSVSKNRYSFLDNNITEVEPEYQQAKIVLSGSVRPSPITLEVKVIEEETKQEGEETTVISSKKKEYTMTTPLKQTITEASAEQVTKGLYALYANAIEAVSPTAEEMVAFGLDEPYSVVSVDFDGAQGFTLKTSSPNENNYVYLMKDNSQMVYLVSASRLSWLTVQTEQLTQSIYVPAQTEELSELRVTSQNKAYDFVVTQSDGEMTVSCNGQEVDGELFEKLYQTITAIPPSKMTAEEPSFDAALTMVVSYRDEERKEDTIELIPTGSGSVYLCINEESKYTASQDMVYQILDNCENVLEGKAVSNLA